jgi:ABC-type polysaccharide/polyol phosphate transport system ATPase subunit
LFYYNNAISKESFGCMPGLYVCILIILSLTLSPHYFEKHILEVDSVQKRYDIQSILSDVYLKCETNDIIGLLGRNGSGKSTLLKIIWN